MTETSDETVLYIPNNAFTFNWPINSLLILLLFGGLFYIIF